MDATSRAIATQVAFKGAIDVAIHDEIDLTSDDGQKRFEQLLSHLTDSLVSTILSGETPEQQMAQVVQGNFPGSTVVTSNQPAQVSYQPTHTQPAPPSFGVTVKGNQFGPLPEWLYEQAAAKGVTEVWDNRDRAQGTKRPWFRSTSGGEEAPAFWPPK